MEILISVMDIWIRKITPITLELLFFKYIYTEILRHLKDPFLLRCYCAWQRFAVITRHQPFSTVITAILSTYCERANEKLRYCDLAWPSYNYFIYWTYKSYLQRENSAYNVLLDLRSRSQTKQWGLCYIWYMLYGICYI